MKEMWKQSKIFFTYWKLVAFKVVNGWFVAVAIAFLAATDGLDWEVFTPFQKFKLAVMCLLAGGKFLEGFFDQTISRMEPQGTVTTTTKTTDTQIVTKTP